MQIKAYIWVLFAAMLWGTTGTAQTFLVGEAHPLTIGAVRLAIGGFGLLAFVWISGKLSGVRIPWLWVGLSALCMALFQPFFFSAVQLTGVAIGTVVAIGSAPAFSGILEALVLKRKPERVWVFSSVLSVAGCILLFANRDSYIVDPLGVMLGLLAGLAFAGYAMFSKNVLGLMEVVPAVAVIFSLSGLGLLPFLFFLDTGYLAEPKNLMIVAYLGLAATSLAYLLFSSGLKTIPSSSAVTLSLAEPLTASVLGVAVVGEALSGQSWFGIALLIGGIALLAFGKNRKA
ncbi:MULTISPECIES: DMT family transporter [unclassified Planococcus (in: firmicutes)]|uniref:DMT family transporter n=1 Tax=unclassified Planococcus (in: firmicutes) TaxID=2662419 RepID=UPI000C327008|nr:MULTISPECIES: EamA family transporter [unclassified Planococcus (in: firmicutes)]AUD14712.1 EamA family transporter [Planococcus sp. MB-3u-03]PKG45018.1 EamA family transporter [Planococcus sp. Urea-trap-24]PKG87361.1 EamA family transporter [Planococcus sp. Urea-3u-39]PKH42486.1 EamA family transporter [Planococcus sp. MB-3u-09]